MAFPVIIYMTDYNENTVTGLERGLAFRIIEGKKEYRIYSDGRIEGFGEGVIIVNYFPHLLATAIQEHEQNRLQRDARRPHLEKDDPASRTA